MLWTRVTGAGFFLMTRVTALLAGSVEPGDGDDGKVHHLPVVNLGETLRAARVTELQLRRFALTKENTRD